LERNFPADSEKIFGDNQNLEGSIDLSKYINLKDFEIVNSGLTSLDFLATIPNKDKITRLGF